MLNNTTYAKLLNLDNVLLIQDNNLKISQQLHSCVQIKQPSNNCIQITIQADATITLLQLIVNTPSLHTEIIIHNNATLNYLLLQNNHEISNLSLKQTLNSNSTVNSYIFNYSHQQHKLNYACDLNAEQANNNLYCLQQTSGTQIYALNININHHKPNCTSSTQIRSIAKDTSLSSVTGKIYVAKHAIGTNANLQTKGLLLSDTAEIDTQPQLEIYNDDLKCSHGATIGSLDLEEIFYLKSRGLTEAQATELLLSAFIAPTLANEVTLPKVIRDLLV
jgi:Fe-S cluster assembly protein SufD